MLANRLLVTACGTLLTLSVFNSAQAQNYPERPIRIVCSGSTQELITRLIAQGITGPLGQPVVVENRATVPIASDTIAKARADGYSVLLAGNILKGIEVYKGKVIFYSMGNFGFDQPLARRADDPSQFQLDY